MVFFRRQTCDCLATRQLVLTPPAQRDIARSEERTHPIFPQLAVHVTTVVLLFVKWPERCAFCALPKEVVKQPLPGLCMEVGGASEHAVHIEERGCESPPV